jgi:predicted nuclease of predicted toxin-antitoxin system
LRETGHAADHLREVGLGGASDEKVRTYAKRAVATLITKDEDFAAIADRDVAVVWIRLGNVTNRALWSAMEPMMPEIVSALESGEVLIEVA